MNKKGVQKIMNKDCTQYIERIIDIIYNINSNLIMYDIDTLYSPRPKRKRKGKFVSIDNDCFGC